MSAPPCRFDGVSILVSGSIASGNALRLTNRVSDVVEHELALTLQDQHGGFVASLRPERA